MRVWRVAKHYEKFWEVGTVSAHKCYVRSLVCYSSGESEYTIISGGDDSIIKLWEFTLKPGDKKGGRVYYYLFDEKKNAAFYK